MHKPQEYLVVVEKIKTGLEARGCGARAFAHSRARVPHASVILVPILRGTQSVLLHRRALNAKSRPGKLSFSGGHVNFDPGVLGGQAALEWAIDQTAVREAREEIQVSLNGEPFIIRRDDIYRFSEFGEFAVGVEDINAANVEYSTGYVILLPNDANIKLIDEEEDRVEILPHQQLNLQHAVQQYQTQPDDFALITGRILANVSAYRLLLQAAGLDS